MAKRKLRLSIPLEQNPFASLSPEELVAEFRKRGVRVERWDRKSVMFLRGPEVAPDAIPVALNEAVTLRLREVGKALDEEERQAKRKAAWGKITYTVVQPTTPPQSDGH